MVSKRLHIRVSVIFDDLSPTHGQLPIAPQIDVLKDLSSEMSLEVAQRRLDIGDISADLPMEILQFIRCLFDKNKCFKKGNFYSIQICRFSGLKGVIYGSIQFARHISCNNVGKSTLYMEIYQKSNKCIFSTFSKICQMV